VIFQERGGLVRGFRLVTGTIAVAGVAGVMLAGGIPAQAAAVRPAAVSAAQAAPAAGQARAGGLARVPAGLRPVVARLAGRPQTARVTTSGDLGLSVSISGTIAVIGAPETNSPDGAVYVYVLKSGEWSQQAVITAPSGIESFGTSVAVSGTTAVIGAPDANDFDGEAYVYVQSGTKWTQQAALPGPTGQDELGWSVAAYESTAVIGAPFANGSTGEAQVYVRSGTKWSQQAVLTAAMPAANSAFGWSVAMTGSTAVIGSPTANSEAGAAYAFVRSGTKWSQQAVLTAADAAADNEFGYSVAMSGSTAVIGSPDSNADAGSAYAFVRLGTTWSQQAEMTASDAASENGFGESVAISGSYAVIGSPYRNSETGAEYVFGLSGTKWLQRAELVDPAGAANDRFGLSVAMTSSTALIGAPGTSNSVGTVYVVDYTEGTL